LHFSSDIWSSVVVLLGLVCVQFGVLWADSIAALGVAVIILVVAYRLAKRAVDVLLDRAPAGAYKTVTGVISHYPEIVAVHDLKIRTAGADTFIKFNIHLPPQLTVYQAHEVCDKLEQEILSLIPRSEISIHLEPHKHEEN
jgi:cation diffusion facilitator family transporter